ncbi:glycosyltransferase [Christiangramia aquimixticola]|uniref:glycosyltransferase n=1 Tax=Christiangramia aquimixticola TaxID=1697558 RepID=UPI003AA8A542
MKIALLAHNKFPISEPYAGGLEMITHLLAWRLKAKGHQVHLYALSGSDPELDIIPLDTPEFDWEEISKYSQNIQCNEMLEAQMMYSHAIQKITESDYDIIHNHSMHYLPIQWGAISNKKVISSFHTPVFKDIHFGLASTRNFNNEYFTVVSQNLGKIYEPLLPHYHVVYNGIEVNHWDFYPEPIKDQVCWVGRICKEKAPHTAIDMALKANKKIILAGPNSESTYYNEQFAPLLDHENVTYAGHLKQSELNVLMGQSEATLFTSVWEEPYGLVLAESLACGTPVIAWKVGASSEILTEESGFVVPPFEKDNFVKAISEVTSLNRQNCRDRAEDFCDVSKMVDGYEALYYKALDMIKEVKTNEVC